ncbi:S-layer homology domain-containing protein [Paenibacillus gorillae]|uniref:S-layer homology domain-containing protein n=1 Tax=Paenibacillus gorillae TaxID=1243662 RepID=UPI0004B19A60|nr:S-layer homology domain-containing protein [Paenibacillus gorillae]
MKKVWISLLSLVVIVGLLMTTSFTREARVEAAAPSFKDVAGHWAQSSINIAAQAGIINGYPDGTFKPEGTITRAEMLKVMALTAHIEVGSATVGKPWYTPFQTALTDAKVYAAGDFSGDMNKPATRLELAKLSMRVAKADYRGKKLSNDELLFRAVNAGLLSRTGAKAETIEPNGTTTRAQAAVLVTRLLKLEKGEKLAVDQGASSAVEIAWHRHNMITMFDQDDLVKFPYSVNINAKYNVTIDQLIVLDPADKSGFYSEYLKGASFYGKDDKEETGAKGYVFAYKLIGKVLKTDSGMGKLIHNSFYMFTEDNSGGFYLADNFNYLDYKLIERPGLFNNRAFLKTDSVGNTGHNFRFEYVYKDFVRDQIKKYKGLPIHLEKFDGSLNSASQIYLTDVKDGWYIKR